MSNLGEAIGWKFNHQEGMDTVDGKITKFPETDGVTLGEDGFPTAADIANWVREYETYLVSIEYIENRVKAYPTIGDQLDMQYHDLLDGTTTWKDAVAKVKSDNPKPD